MRFNYHFLRWKHIQTLQIHRTLENGGERKARKWVVSSIILHPKFDGCTFFLGHSTSQQSTLKSIQTIKELGLKEARHIAPSKPHIQKRFLDLRLQIGSEIGIKEGTVAEIDKDIHFRTVVLVVQSHLFLLVHSVPRKKELELLQI